MTRSEFYANWPYNTTEFITIVCLVDSLKKTTAWAMMVLATLEIYETG
jgi:hypothetical protein